MFVEIASFDTGAKIFAGVAEKNKLIQKYLDTMNDVDIDLLILPASLVPAPKKVGIYTILMHRGYEQLLKASFTQAVKHFQEYRFFQEVPTAGCTWLAWNLFDFPAGILPITNVTEEDNKNLNTIFPTNDLVRIIYTIRRYELSDI